MNPGLDPSPIHGGFVVDGVTKEKVFSRYHGFISPFTLRRCSIFLFHVFTVDAM